MDQMSATAIMPIALTMHVCGDARAYIQQLENQIGELTEKVEQLEATHPKLGRKGTFEKVSCKGVCERS